MRIAKQSLVAGALLVLLFVGQSDAAYRDEVLARSPVGYWEFNGDATDSTANGNDLTLMANATTPATGGIVGGALDLPGPLAPDGGSCFNCGLRLSEHDDGAFVVTPEGNVLNLTTTTFSIVAWVNPTLESDSVQREPDEPTGQIGTMMIVNKRRATNWTGDGGWWDYSMWMAGFDGNAETGFYRAYGFQSAGVTNIAPPESVALTSPQNNFIVPPFSKEWHMLGMTWEQGVSTKYYIDGELKYEPFDLNNVIQSGSAHELLIGARARPSREGGADDSPGDNFIGKIDEVAIYDTRLTDADMMTLFSAATSITGDLDCDGDVDFDDIDDFVLGLNNPAEYLSNMGVPASLKGDTDGDGDLDFDDITGFVNILSGGGLQSVPEPSTLVLLGMSGLMGVWMLLRRRR